MQKLFFKGSTSVSATANTRSLQERIAVQVSALDGAFVNVLAFFLLRDDSRDSHGNVDDPIFGIIDAVVIADVI